MAALADEVGIVSHVKVLSDGVEDVSSLNAWRQSFINPGMNDREKALAVWRSAVAFRHQDIPPNEFLSNEGHPHDPIESFNVYGYGQCCCASAHVEALARYIGLEARGWGITAHSVPEVRIGGRWCMFDASLINYFQKTDGSIAGVEEISQNIGDWYDRHPELRDNNDKLYQFMTAGSWKANGPALLAGGTGYDANGWLPAGTHGWYSSVQEFGRDKQNFQYEYGAALGYEVNVQLRSGERLVRNWSNKGLHVNMLDGAAPGVMSAVVGKDQLRYSPSFGDLAPGRVGNGTWTYDLPLTSPALRDAALSFEHLATRPSGAHEGPALRVADGATEGTLVLRMPSSYIYLGGHLSLTPNLPQGGWVELLFSDNNALDWRQVGRYDASKSQEIDLRPLVFRRYDYRLKVIIHGSGAGLDAIHLTHDVQHSQRPLPALHEGTNKIHVIAGAAEGTITVEGSINPAVRGKQVLLTDFHPQLDGIEASDMRLTGGEGQIIVPIETPGDLSRLRVGCHYRARDVQDGWTVEASFDGGHAWQPVGTLEGPHVGFSKYFVFDQVPPGRRAALVRFRGRQRNTTLLLDLRISADYHEPHGGFAPVRVTYAWAEGGQSQRDVHVVRQPDETYTIQCHARPTMASLALERAE